MEGKGLSGCSSGQRALYKMLSHATLLCRLLP